MDTSVMYITLAGALTNKSLVCCYRLNQWTRASRFSPERYVDCEALLSSPVFDIFRSSYHNFDKKPLEGGQNFASFCQLIEHNKLELVLLYEAKVLRNEYLFSKLRIFVRSIINSVNRRP